MKQMKTIVVAAVAILAVATGAAAQQTQSGQSQRPTSGSTQATHAGANHMNDAQFVAMMMQHHRDGIEMARIAEQKATTAEVKSLAREIREGQEREAQEMKPFAGGQAAPTGTSGQRPAQAGAHGDHQAHMEQSKKAVERVRTATGTQVDHAFLEEMSKHHQMAIQMARDTQFQNAKLKQLADKMSANQAREVEELKRAHQRVS